MEDKKAMMASIKERIDEIFSHSEEISELHFDARIQNGTRFQFNYNAEEFAHSGKDRVKKYRISTLNAVIDIIGATLCVALLVLACVNCLKGEAASDAFVIMTFCCFLAFFTESSVYHLFNENHARAIRTLFIVRHALLTLSLMAMTCALSLRVKSGNISYLLSFFVVALSIFFSFLDTKLSNYLANLSHILFPLLMLLFIPFSYQILCLASMLILSALASSLLPGVKNSVIRASKSNGIFLIMSLFLFYLALGAL